MQKINPEKLIYQFHIELSGRLFGSDIKHDLQGSMLLFVLTYSCETWIVKECVCQGFGSEDNFS